MDNTIRFICPDCTEEGRKERFIKNIEKWVYSDALSDMVSVFGYSIPENLGLKSTIAWLNDFADEWDYRKKQANGGERWNVTEDEFALQNRDTIWRCVKTLGLADIKKPLVTPNYILPLGGARRSNIVRPLLAKDIISSGNIKNAKIVALSGNRPIDEAEKPFLADYAPDARTEYEAISSGMEKVFGLLEHNYHEKTTPPNPPAQRT